MRSACSICTGDHYLAWAEPFYDAVRARVAFVEGNLFHLWHGETETAATMNGSKD